MTYDKQYDSEQYDYEDYDYLYESNKATRRRQQKTNNWKFKTETSGKKKPATKIFTINGSPADIKAREQAKLVKRAREHKGTIEVNQDQYEVQQYESKQTDKELNQDENYYDYGPYKPNRQKLHAERVKQYLKYYEFGLIYSPSDHYYSTHSPSLIKGTWRKIKPTECDKVRPTECDKVEQINPTSIRRKRAFWELDEIDLNEPLYKMSLLNPTK